MPASNHHHSTCSSSYSSSYRKSTLHLTAVVTTLITTLLLMLGCSDADTDTDSETIIKGLKGFRVSQSADSETRRYPSVVQPAQESKLSFEVAGKLKDLTLEVGQRVSQGQVLVEIDPVSLELKEQQAKASLDEARAAFKNASSDYERKAQLMEKNYVTQAEIDDAANKVKSTRAQVEQATKQLDLAKKDLSKTQLISPFDGVVSSIEAQDYGQIGAGEPVLGIYSENGYEASFSVPAVIINSLKLGDTARVTFADLTDETFSGHIKELGSRAGQVSAFPVVVALDEAPEGLRAGMAADIALTIRLAGSDTQATGYLVPLNCFYFGAYGQDGLGDVSHRDIRRGYVFLYDQASSTVRKQAIDILGIRENMAIVNEGISEGDIVAAAGVSYLYDGQQVKLLPLANEQ